MVTGLAEDTGSKMSIMRIAQVLLRESDKEHPLTQQEILEYLEKKYGMTVNRKSISRNLARLREAGMPVMCREVTRVVNGKETTLALDWYWDHAISQEELKQLIDLLYFSHIPMQQVKTLSEKLKKLHSHSFEDGKENVRNLPALRSGTDVDRELEILSRACTQKKQIRFFYDHYEADGKKHHGRTVSGEDRRYQASPYRLIASDDRYVLLCNLEGSEEVSVFKVDFMAEIEILEEPVRLQTTLDSLEKGGKLTDYIFAYRGMYTGVPVLCTFDADWHLMNDIIDDFGKSARIISARQDQVTVKVTLPVEAMKSWALKHAPLVKMRAPSYLVKEVKEAAAALSRLYESL